ncbi:two-partner secretion domain-containing protein, partial [Acaryochloris marina NIES-2412]|uniref:two-partner secretion domain-containing protein n=1 Tax=Acaryochloris marina TaxID=155978 RepID=UPI0040587E90
NTANLFFLNPNGIIFGNRARLDIGGSFLGTSASSIQFNDGFQFSAISPDPHSLLTVAAPLGIQLRSSSGDIRVINNGHQLTGELFSPVSRKDNPPGLEVLPGRTLALVGGDVFLNGGAVYAPGGRIEIGSVKQGQINVDTTSTQWSFSYSPQSTFAEITLSNRSLLDTTGQGGASIEIYGRRIKLLEDSVALMQNQGVIPDKELRLSATELIYIGNDILPNELPVGLYSESINSGSGADITLFSPIVVVRDGGTLASRTFTTTDGGNISIGAPKYLNLEGRSPLETFAVSLINTITFGSGKAGNMNITASHLAIKNGARLSSATFSEGEGGTVSVSADLVEVIGFEPQGLQESDLSSASLGLGNAGSLVINTSKLIVADGGRVNTSISNSGDGGNLEISASEYIQIVGSSGKGPPATIAANAIQVDPVFRQLLKLPPLPSGDSGSVTINTPRLNVTDGGLIAVRNEGIGKAGELKISASTITLEDKSSLSATTLGGDGGNIFVFADFLLIRDSSITASASKKGKGGNITTIADLVVALGESSLTAEAEKGQGGNILIAGKAVLLGPDVDISVSSDAGLQASGTFRVVVEEQDFNETSAPTPDVLSAPKIISACNPSTEPSRFVVMGPGRLRIKPSTTGPSNLGWDRKVTTIQSKQSPVDISKPSKIIEAKGWQKINDNKVVLTATPENNQGNLIAENPVCNTPSS